MRKSNVILLSLFALITLSGCATIQLPSYIPDKKPVTRRFYVDYDRAYSVTRKALEELGWKVEATTDPAIYEGMKTPEPGSRQILIMTELKQMPMLVMTRYSRLNVYVRSKKSETDIEVRFQAVTAFPVKNLKSYKHAKTVDDVYAKISDLLNAPE
ncbi:MAG: hypothetical protein Q8Q08_07695 [Candidatus Omnitrophota bacterium]|nr:hypothetical protein [Candidatus Omnitrophota bacterium]MDZ4242313.1 hypothetical protein [Candidatus Omnitrophota bacterium]